MPHIQTIIIVTDPGTGGQPLTENKPREQRWVVTPELSHEIEGLLLKRSAAKPAHG